MLKKLSSAIDRRSFLSEVAKIGVAAGIGGAGYKLYRDHEETLALNKSLIQARSETNKKMGRLTIGVIGTGGRGEWDWHAAQDSGLFSLSSIADPNDPARSNFLHSYREREMREGTSNRVIESGPNYRTVLEDKSVQGVIIATPPHWHAKLIIEALEAGKHVYCEKPMAITVETALLVREVVQQHPELVFQLGTQRRSCPLVERAVQLLQEGIIGKVHSATCFCDELGTAMAVPSPQKTPSNLDWDRWLGPAPVVPYSKERQQNAMGFADYSHGQLSNWGSHLISTAMQGLTLDDQQPVSAAYHSVEFPENNHEGILNPSRFRSSVTFPRGEEIHIVGDDSSHRVQFDGEHGSLTILQYAKLIDASGTVIARIQDCFDGKNRQNWQKEVTKIHLQNWYNCIRNTEKGTYGKNPHSGIESQTNATITFLAAAVARKLGKTVAWNHETASFGSDTEANALRQRPERNPYEIRRRAPEPFVATAASYTNLHFK
jgi:predicted dehydrogenase